MLPHLRLLLRPLPSTLRHIVRTMATTPPPSYTPTPAPRYIDIGINLTDPVFSGNYHGKQAHPADIPSLLSRAEQTNITQLIITGSDLANSRAALALCSHSRSLFTTVGVHPCSINTITKCPSGPTAHLAELAALAKSSPRVISFGEIGLDYDRLHYTSVELQREYFRLQLDVAEQVQLPLFLHMRAAFGDFAAELFPRLRAGKLPKGGVVHSFTGTKEEMLACVAEGLYIGLNGCSLKTEENLEVVKAVPLERLCVESDGPWCEVRPSSAGAMLLQEDGGIVMPGWPGMRKEKWKEDRWVKGRNESGACKVVVEIIAKVLGEKVETVAEAAWQNSMKLFEFPEVVEEVKAEAAAAEGVKEDVVGLEEEDVDKK